MRKNKSIKKVKGRDQERKGFLRIMGEEKRKGAEKKPEEGNTRGIEMIEGTDRGEEDAKTVEKEEEVEEE
jgi:hypothetical protein